MKYFIKELKRFNQIYGRTAKLDFWMFLMVDLLIVFFLVLTGTVIESFIAIYNIFTYLMIIPILTAQIRRLHDINKSGRYVFLNLIPLVGQVYLFYLLTKDGEAFINQYDYILNQEELQFNKE